MGDTKAGAYGLAACGLANVGRQVWNPGEAALSALAQDQGEPDPVLTGDDRFVVQGVATADRIAWSEHNRPFSPTTCSRVWGRIQAVLQGREVFVVEGFAGTDSDDRTAVRVVSDRASHALHATRRLHPVEPQDVATFLPDLTVVVAAGFQASPEIDGTAGRRCCILDPDRALVLLGGPCASSELFDAVAKAVGFLRSRQGVLALPGVAGIGPEGATLFLGLDGTGRRTLARGLGGEVVEGAVLWTGAGLEPVWRGTPTGHPAHIVFVVADATGVLPALARLSVEQAAQWFALGYAAARDGAAPGETTDAGLAFSPGCGARHHMLPVATVVDRFLAKLRHHAPNCWLVDTGWPGGGTTRRAVADTQGLLRDAFQGRLTGWRVDSVFGFEVPAGIDVGLGDKEALARRMRDAAGRIRGDGCGDG